MHSNLLSSIVIQIFRPLQAVGFLDHWGLSHTQTGNTSFFYEYINHTSVGTSNFDEILHSMSDFSENNTEFVIVNLLLQCTQCSIQMQYTPM